MSNGVILFSLALALIIGAIIMGVSNHPWLCLLFIVCVAMLSINTSGKSEGGSNHDNSTT